MLSGGLDQYITYQSEVKLATSILMEIKLVCPNHDRWDVIDKLWNDGWEITRSGPSIPDYDNQLIKALKEIKN